LVGAPGKQRTPTPETVQSIERASRLITALAERPYSMTVRELAARAGLSPTSVHRMLTTLVSIGWAHQNSNTGRYRLGTEILGIGAAGLVTDPVVQNGRTFLQRFVDLTGQTCFLSTLVGARVVYLARCEGPRVPQFGFEPGLSMPAHALADGKLIMAFMPQEEREYFYRVEDLRRYTSRTLTTAAELEAQFVHIREQGYAVDRGERYDEFWGIALPVLRSEDRIRLAMLSIGTGELAPDAEAAMVTQMRAVIADMADHLALVGDLPKPGFAFARANLE
jgi:IclR family acetate operon transcriptional repressor